MYYHWLQFGFSTLTQSCNDLQVWSNITNKKSRHETIYCGRRKTKYRVSNHSSVGLAKNLRNLLRMSKTRCPTNLEILLQESFRINASLAASCLVQSLCSLSEDWEGWDKIFVHTVKLRTLGPMHLYVGDVVHIELIKAPK